jgi:ketosteroid isomerase-like protein
MSSQNVQIVRGIFEAADRDDIEGMLRPVKEDIVVHDPTRIDAGVYHGLEGLMEWMAEWSEIYDWGIEAEEFLDAGDRIVALARWRNRDTGGKIELLSPFGMVFTIEDGRVARLDYFNDRRAALEAAGIEDQGG